MNSLLLQHRELVERLGWTLAHSVWQIAAIALLLGLSRWVFRSPSVRYFLAMLTLVACVALPAATFVHLERGATPMPVTAKLRPALTLPSDRFVQPLQMAKRQPAVQVSQPVKQSHLVAPSVTWQARVRQALPWAVMAWLIGMGCLVIRHLGGLWSLHRLRSNGLIAVNAEVQRVFDQARKRLGLRRMVRVFESSKVVAPMVIGTLKPVVLLPCSALTGLSPGELEALLAHEVAHLRRWDDVANLLQCVIETVLFFHPALWWISHVAREERELCCDDLAVAGGVERQDLARALGHVALWQMPALQPSLAATGHMPVLARIKRLLHPPRPSITVSAWPFVALLLLVASVFFMPAQTKAGGAISRGRILDRNGIVLAGNDAAGARHYPLQSMAAHIIGYTGRKSSHDATPVGRSGLELSQDKILSAGNDVKLRLDARLQQIAEIALSKGAPRGGACVVIDPNNGDVLAMASFPSFDLNSFIPLTTETYERLNKDPRGPLNGRAFQGNYFPASTFKLVTALAALKTGAIDQNTMFDSPNAYKIGDRVFHNWNKNDEEPMNVIRALKRSSNTWFYQVGLKTGAEPIIDLANQLGFGHATGLPIAGEGGGSLPSDEIYMQRYGYKISPGILASISIGQVVQVTPLQAAMANAAIGNGGKVWAPRLLESQSERTMVNDLLDHGITNDHLDIIKKGMIAVVQGEGGTGHRAAVPGVVVAGKTGTAQWKVYEDQSKNRNLAWFTGFAPAEHPRLAIAIVYEGSPGESVSGGYVCAPIANTVLRESLAVLDGKKYEVVPQINGVNTGETTSPVEPRKAASTTYNFNQQEWLMTQTGGKPLPLLAPHPSALDWKPEQKVEMIDPAVEENPFHTDGEFRYRKVGPVVLGERELDARPRAYLDFKGWRGKAPPPFDIRIREYPERLDTAESALEQWSKNVGPRDMIGKTLIAR